MDPRVEWWRSVSAAARPEQPMLVVVLDDEPDAVSALPPDSAHSGASIPRTDSRRLPESPSIWGVPSFRGLRTIAHGPRPGAAGRR